MASLLGEGWERGAEQGWRSWGGGLAKQQLLQT